MTRVLGTAVAVLALVSVLAVVVFLAWVIGVSPY